MKMNRWLSLFLLLFLVVSYQNCASNLNSEKISPTNPNAGGDEFVAKLAADFSSVHQNPSCNYIPTDCSDLVGGSLEETACVQANVSDMYAALACEGYEVQHDQYCYIAVSGAQVQSMSDVKIDATCFVDPSATHRSLHLDTCIASDAGSGDNPGSGNEPATAWLSFGNQYPYSRVTSSLQYHSSQSNVTLALANLADSSGSSFTDDCGKNQMVRFLGLNLALTVVP